MRLPEVYLVIFRSCRVDEGTRVSAAHFAMFVLQNCVHGLPIQDILRGCAAATTFLYERSFIPYKRKDATVRTRLGSRFRFLRKAIQCLRAQGR